MSPIASRQEQGVVAISSNSGRNRLDSKNRRDIISVREKETCFDRASGLLGQ